MGAASLSVRVTSTAPHPPSKPLFVLLIAAVAGPVHASSWDQMAADIGARIRANGVTEFTAAAVDLAASAPGRQVGTCDAGRKKITYVRGASDAAAAVAPASSLSPRAVRPGVITECADGRVIEEGACEKKK